MDCDKIIVLNGREAKSLRRSSRGLAVLSSKATPGDRSSATPSLVALSSSATTERGGFPGIVGGSTALSEVLDQVRTVAPTDSTVLIEGETGADTSSAIAQKCAPPSPTFTAGGLCPPLLRESLPLEWILTSRRRLSRSLPTGCSRHWSWACRRRTHRAVGLGRKERLR
jgi:hypothetical protein